MIFKGIRSPRTLALFLALHTAFLVAAPEAHALPRLSSLLSRFFSPPAPVTTAALPYQAFGEFKPILHHIATEDGAENAVVELEGNDGAEVVVIQPGMIENAEAMRLFAIFFQREGYKVFILQSRYVGRGEYKSKLAPAGRNGLDAVLIKDPSALYRYLIKRYGEKLAMHVIGHSKGGMQVLAVMNDPARAAEFGPYIKTFVPVGSPHRLADLPWYVVKAAELLLPFLETLEHSGVESIDFHHDLFDITADWKTQKSRILYALARVVERPITRVTYEVMVGILLSRFTTPQEARRLVRQQISAFPVEFTAGMARAAVNGLPVPMDPEKLQMPTMVVSMELDRLVRRWLQNEFFQRLTGAFRRAWMLIENTHHVDPATSEQVAAAVLPRILHFIRNYQSLPVTSGSEVTEEDIARAGGICAKNLVAAP